MSKNEAFSAGKAFGDLCRILSGEKKREPSVRIYPLMRQEIDIEKLCKALWMMAKTREKKIKVLDKLLIGVRNITVTLC